MRLAVLTLLRVTDPRSANQGTASF